MNAGPRPLGLRIRAICEIVERLGVCNRFQIMARLEEEMNENTMRVYCSRAVHRAMLTSDKGNYRVTPNWRALAENPTPEDERPRPQRVKSPIPARTGLDAWLTGAQA